MQRWEYLTIQLGYLSKEGYLPIAPRFANGQELKDWISLSGYVSQLGEEGWEMAGTISVPGTSEHYLFFKRMVFDVVTGIMVP